MGQIDDIKLRYPDNYIGITRGFTSSHRGADLGWNGNYGGQNCSLFAPADGSVVSTVDSMNNTWSTGVATWGNYVKIDHGGQVYTLMAHLLKGSISAAGIRAGSKVKRGQLIGSMNNSGYSNGSHLHYEVYLGGAGTGSRVDPLKYTYVYTDQVVSPNTACRDQIKHLGEAPDPAPAGTVGTPVKPDTMKNQVEITTSVLFGRSSPTRPENNGNVAGYMTPGYYNIIQTKDMIGESSNGYLWYEVEANLWLADIGDPGVIRHPSEGPVVQLYDMSLFDMTERDKNIFEHEAIGRSIRYNVTAK